MTDPRTLAQRLGADETEALVMAAWKLYSEGDPSIKRFDLAAAARKLAEPEPVTPLWPKDLRAYFRHTGELYSVYWGSALEKNPGGTVLHTAKLVPADAVVLTREEWSAFGQMAEMVGECQRNYVGGEVIERIDAALRREREGK